MRLKNKKVLIRMPVIKTMVLLKSKKTIRRRTKLLIFLLRRKRWMLPNDEILAKSGRLSQWTTVLMPLQELMSETTNYMFGLDKHVTQI